MYMEKKTKNVYGLPISRKDIVKIFFDAPTHKIWINPKTKEINDESNAVDFVCDEGVLVRASFDGKVVFVLDGLTKNWNDIKNSPPESVMPFSETSGNIVVIEHVNKEVSWYCHLKNGSIRVKVGDIVKMGDVVGLTGNTGMSLGPHLHFLVSRLINEKKDMSYRSLVVRWEDEDVVKKCLGKLG